jgi:hypothetical protein
MSRKLRFASIVALSAGLGLAACSSDSNGSAASDAAAGGTTGTGGTSGGQGGAAAGGTSGGQGGAGAGGTSGGQGGTVGGDGGTSGGQGGAAAGGTSGGQGGSTSGPECDLPACVTAALTSVGNSCTGTGACVTQSATPSLQNPFPPTNVCYANGVKAHTVTMVDLMTMSGSVKYSVTKTDGVSPCFSFEATISPPATVSPFTVKDGAGTTLFTIANNPDMSVSYTCPGAAPKTIAKSCTGTSSMLPMPSASSTCTKGTCE